MAALEGEVRLGQLVVLPLGPGEVGFFTAAIKQVADTRVGDTVTDERHPTDAALPGFKPAQPVVFCGLVDLASERIGGKAVLANDEFFASKENLLKSGRGIAVPEKYTE